MKNMRLFSQLIFVVSLSFCTLFFFSSTYTMTQSEEQFGTLFDAHEEPVQQFSSDLSWLSETVFDELGTDNDIEAFMKQLQTENDRQATAAAAVENRPITPKQCPRTSPDNSNVAQYLRDDPSDEFKKIAPKKPESNNNALEKIANNAENNQTTLWCKKCSKKYTNVDEFKQHMQLHVKVTCPECGKPVKDFDRLKQHIQEKHTKNRDPKFICPECGKGYHSATRMNAHIYTHTQKPESEEFACTICRKVCKNSAGLTLHMRKHTKDLEPENNAYEPDKATDEAQVSTGYRVKKRPNYCEREDDDDDDNLDDDDDNDTKFPCQKCDKICTSSAGLKNHMHKHIMDLEPESDAYESDDEDNSDLRFKCKKCKRRFEKANGLALHIRAHKRKEQLKKYAAEDCDDDDNDDDDENNDDDDSSKKIGKKSHDSKKLKCITCKRFLSTRQCFLRHINSHVSSKISSRCAIIRNTPEKIVVKITKIRKLQSNGR